MKAVAQSFEFDGEAVAFAFFFDGAQNHLQFSDFDLDLIIRCVPRLDVIKMNDEIGRLAGVGRRRRRRDRQDAAALANADRTFGDLDIEKTRTTHLSRIARVPPSSLSNKKSIHARNRIEKTGLNRRRVMLAEAAPSARPPMLLWILSSGGVCTLSGALGLGHLYELGSAGKGVALIVSVIAAMICFAAMDIRDERLVAQPAANE